MNRLILRETMRDKSTGLLRDVESISKAAQSEMSGSKEKKEEEKKVKEEKNYLLAEFFDKKVNFGLFELRAKERPGRSWTIEELRLKSNSDLHKLWYVLLKERNMLLTMKEAYVVRARIFPNPERLDRVDESMKNLETVVHERNDAFLRLETGEGASPPTRRVTSFAGFTYEQPAKEHYEPAEVTGDKEYEVPYLDDDAYLMQKLWNEKQFLKKEIETHDKYMHKLMTEDHVKYRQGLRRRFDRVEHMPKYIAAEKKPASCSN
ncbi:mitochondrial 39-S ribosomal protein l47 (MRP-L47) domain-containing protein [Ditylenchus destructor]|nr:mitochondrial 39-S ribosomal protein l47 (MRP-L47) domain-containing protein [Ditylenchus destructor]